MKIGLVCEGSYPYVSGGVSSWTQGLIEGMPEHRFTILAIIPATEDQVLQYKLPPNVDTIIDIPIQFERKSGVKKPSFSLNADEFNLIASFFERNNPSAEVLQLLHALLQDVSPSSFLQSDIFYEIAKRCSIAEQNANFIEYYYMLQGMYLPALTILQQPMPKLDVIHSVSTGYAGLLATRIATDQRIPFLLTEHGIYTREREEEILLSDWIPESFKIGWIRFFQHIGMYAYLHAHSVITLFEQNSRLQEANGAPTEKLSIIPNGVVLPAGKPAAARQSKTFQIGSVLRVVPIKDVKTMLYAARELKDRGILFNWQVLGPMSEDPAYAAECLELLDQLQLSKDVIFTGKVNVKDYLPTFDLMVLSSLSEGQPLSILEAFSYRVPCIATDVGSCRELIEGTLTDTTGHAGIVVNPLDSQAMAGAIIHLMQHEELRVEMGEVARQRVSKRYLQTQMLSAYQILYKKGVTY